MNHERAINDAIDILRWLIENENCTDYVDSFIEKTIEVLEDCNKGYER